MRSTREAMAFADVRRWQHLSLCTFRDESGKLLSSVSVYMVVLSHADVHFCTRSLRCLVRVRAKLHDFMFISCDVVVHEVVLCRHVASWCNDILDAFVVEQKHSSFV